MFLSLIAAFFLVINLSNAYGENNSPNKKSFETTTAIADWIDRKARDLDLALSGSRYTKNIEDSQAEISQEFFWKETEGFQYDIDFDLDLALPNFEKKYKVMISSYNRRQQKRSNYSQRNLQNRKDKSYGASLALIEKIGDYDVSFEPRIEIKDGLQTFYTLDFSNEFDLLSHKFLNRFEFFADSIKGTGQFIELRLRKSFWTRWGHSIILEEEYQDAENLLSLLSGYSLHVNINRRMTLTQSFVFRTENKVRYKLNEVDLGPSFSHEVLKNELIYTLTYNYNLDREDNYAGRHNVSLVLSFVF